MESKLFFVKLIKSKLSIIIIALVFVLSAFSLLYIFSEFGPVYFIEATKLDEEPEKYFLLNNPEFYGIQRIFNSSIGIEIDEDVISEIMEMQNNFGTKNVKYSNNYYEIQLLLGDKFPPYPLLWLSITCLFVSGILMIGVLIVRIKVKWLKNFPQEEI